jgi:hypothetical protein
MHLVTKGLVLPAYFLDGALRATFKSNLIE